MASPFFNVANNVFSSLRSAHAPDDGALLLLGGTGGRFGSEFPIRVSCVRRADSALAIFRVTARSGDTLTVSGTIEGTTDIALGVGDVCEMRWTAGGIVDIQDRLLYTSESPTTAPLGGIPAGTTFDEVLLGEVLDQLLHPYQAPAFTAFSITGATTQEVGASFSGNKDFTWSTSNSGNVADLSVEIEDTTGSVTLASGLPNTGSTTHGTSATHASPATHVWTISALDTLSDGFSTTTSISWLWRVYYGTSTGTTLNEAGVEALASGVLKAGFAGTYSYAGGGYKYLCFPDEMGGPTSFTDSLTQLSVAMCGVTDDASYDHTDHGFSYALVPVTNSQAITTNYRVYRTKNILGGTISIIVA